MKKTRKPTLAFMAIVLVCLLVTTATAVGKLVLPKKIKIIDAEAFYQAQMIDYVTLPDGVEEIGSKAFAYSSLKEINLPSSLTLIAEDVFEGCGEIIVSSEPGCYAYDWAVMHGYILPENVFTYEIDENNGYGIITGYTGLGGSVTVPAQIDGVMIKYIGSNVFADRTDITEIIFEEGIVQLHSGAFCGCTNLVRVVLADTISAYDSNVFYGCSSLKSIELSENARRISSGAFANCSSLEGITFGYKVQELADDAFSGCEQLSVVHAYRASLGEQFALENGFDLTILDPQTTDLTDFEYVAETEVDWINYYRIVEYFGDAKRVILPKRIYGYEIGSIDAYAFADCNEMHTLVLPDSPNNGISINKYAFKRCNNLTSIEIPADVYSIHSLAFDARSKWLTIYGEAGSCAESYAAQQEIAFVVGHVPQQDIEPETDETLPEAVPIEERYNYEVMDDGLLRITEYLGGDQYVVIPDTLNGVQVAAIGSSAFDHRTDVKKVEIPDGVKTIEENAFSYCKKLEEISIPESLTTIGRSAFSGCMLLESIVIPGEVTALEYNTFGYCYALEHVELPDSIQTFGNDVFRSCYSLESIELPESLVSIGGSAFTKCTALQSIVIPESVTSIAAHVFSGCESLTKATVPSSVKSFGIKIFNGCSADLVVYGEEGSAAQTYAESYCIPFMAIGEEEITFEYSISDGKVTITGYTGTETQVTVPDAIDSYPVYSIGMNAFFGCEEIESIALPEGLARIENGAFYGCSALKSITIPESVIYIGEEAFFNCHVLASVDIPDSVETIGAGAFTNCSALTEIMIPDGITGIGDSTFYGCSALETLEIPDSVMEIGDSAFAYCEGLKAVDISESVTHIGSSAFVGCTSLTEFVLPDSVSSLGFGVFTDCTALKTVTLSKSITVIPEIMFHTCSALKSIIIPDGVTTIEEYAFCRCASLDSIIIPASVNAIETGAFLSCSDALTIYGYPDTYAQEYAQENDIAFVELSIEDPTAGFVYEIVNDGAIITGYEGENSDVVIPEQIEGYAVIQIASKAFEDNTLLTTIALPESLVSIGSFAFSGCENLTSINIPDGITSIGGWAFQSCSSLTSVKLPSGLTSVERGVFNGCKGLTEIDIPDTVTLIANNAFSNCVGVAELELPEGLLTIEAGAFTNWNSLTSVTIPASVVSLSESGHAFLSCDNLMDIHVAEGNEVYASVDGVLFSKDMTKMLQYPFGRVEESYTIPEHVTVLGNRVFDSNQLLKTVIVSGELSEIQNGAFYGCTSLVSVELPDTIKTIGIQAFANCSSLATLSLSTAVESIAENAFAGCDALVIDVESGSYAETYCIEHAIPYQINGIVPVTGIELYPEAMTMNNNGVRYVSARVLPTNGTNANVIWESSDSSIVSVDEYGILTSNAVGEAIITAATEEGAFTDTCVVTVVERIIGSVSADREFALTGEAIVFTVEKENGGSEVEYVFTIYCDGEAILETETLLEPVYTFTPETAGVYSVHAKISDETGAIAYARSENVTVNPADIGEVSISVDNEEVEAGNPVLLTAEVANQEAQELTYTFGVYRYGVCVYAGEPQTEKMCSYTPIETGLYEARVTVENAAGEQSETVEVLFTVVMRNVDISLISITDAVVHSEAFLAQVVAENTYGTYQYEYEVTYDGRIVASSGKTQEDTFTFIPSELGTYVFSASVEDETGASASYYTEFVVVMPEYELNIIEISANAGIVMVNEAIQLSVVMENSNVISNCQYEVYLDGVKIDSFAGGNSVTYIPENTGIYSFAVLVTDVYGNSRSCYQADLVYVKPYWKLSGIDVSEMELILGESVTCTAYAEGNTDGLQYRFDVTKNGEAYLPGVFGEEQACTFKPLEVGNYTITAQVTDSDGEVQSLTSNEVVVAIGEVEADEYTQANQGSVLNVDSLLDCSRTEAVVDHGDVTVTWSNVDSEAYYSVTIRRDLGENGYENMISLGNYTSNSYTIAARELTPGYAYHVRIRGYDANGASLYSSKPMRFAVVGESIMLEERPTFVVPNPAETEVLEYHDVQLQWKKMKYATSYQLLFEYDDGGMEHELESITVAGDCTSYTLDKSKLIAGMTYTAVLYAYDDQGNCVKSKKLSFRIVGDEELCVLTKPKITSKEFYSTDSRTELYTIGQYEPVVVKWDDVPAAEYYSVKVKNRNTSEELSIAGADWIAENYFSIPLDYLESGTAYEVSVYAHHTDECYTVSSKKYFRAPYKDNLVLNPPEVIEPELSLDSITPYSFVLQDLTIQWNPVTAAETYSLYLMEEGDSDYINFEIADLKATSVTIPKDSFDTGTWYKLRIFAHDANENVSAAEYYLVACKSTIAPTTLISPQLSTNADVPNKLSQNDLTLVWTAVDDAETYKVILREYYNESWDEVYRIENLTEPTCVIPEDELYMGTRYRLTIWSADQHGNGKWSEKYYFQIGGDDYIALSKNEWDAAYVAVSKSFNVDTTAIWTATVSDSSWISIDKTSGESASYVRVSLTANEDSFARTGNVTFRTSAGGCTVLSITQAPNGESNSGSLTIVSPEQGETCEYDKIAVEWKYPYDHAYFGVMLTDIATGDQVYSKDSTSMYYDTIPAAVLTKGGTYQLTVAAYNAQYVRVSESSVVFRIEGSFSGSTGSGSGDGGSEEETTSTGVMVWNGHTYQVLDESMTWTEAKVYCESKGGYLVTITSEQEQQAVQSLLADYGEKNMYWIGLNEAGEASKWVTGETYRYSNWADGEPNGGSETYAEIYRVGSGYGEIFTWNDSTDSAGGSSFHALSNHGLICEYGAVEVEQPETDAPVITVSGISEGSSVEAADFTVDWNDIDGADHYFVALRDLTLYPDTMDPDDVVKPINEEFSSSEVTITAELLTPAHGYRLWIAARNENEEKLTEKTIHFSVAESAEDVVYLPTATFNADDVTIPLGEPFLFSGTVSANGGTLKRVRVTLIDATGNFCDYAICDETFMQQNGSDLTSFDLAKINQMLTGEGTEVASSGHADARPNTVTLNLDTAGEQFTVNLYAMNEGAEAYTLLASKKIILRKPDFMHLLDANGNDLNGKTIYVDYQGNCKSGSNLLYMHTNESAYTMWSSIESELSIRRTTTPEENTFDERRYEYEIDATENPYATERTFTICAHDVWNVTNENEDASRQASVTVVQEKNPNVPVIASARIDTGKKVYDRNNEMQLYVGDHNSSEGYELEVDISNDVQNTSWHLYSDCIDVVKVYQKDGKVYVKALKEGDANIYISHVYATSFTSKVRKCAYRICSVNVANSSYSIASINDKLYKLFVCAATAYHTAMAVQYENTWEEVTTRLFATGTDAIVDSFVDAGASLGVFADDEIVKIVEMMVLIEMDQVEFETNTIFSDFFEESNVESVIDAFNFLQSKGIDPTVSNWMTQAGELIATSQEQDIAKFNDYVDMVKDACDRYHYYSVGAKGSALAGSVIDFVKSLEKNKAAYETKVYIRGAAKNRLNELTELFTDKRILDAIEDYRDSIDNAIVELGIDTILTVLDKGSSTYGKYCKFVDGLRDAKILKHVPLNAEKYLKAERAFKDLKIANKLKVSDIMSGWKVFDTIKTVEGIFLDAEGFVECVDMLNKEAVLLESEYKTMPEDATGHTKEKLINRIEGARTLIGITWQTLDEAMDIAYDMYVNKLTGWLIYVFDADEHEKCLNEVWEAQNEIYLENKKMNEVASEVIEMIQNCPELE